MTMKANKSHHSNQGRKQNEKMPEFIVHVSVELADSMVEEKLRYTTNKENQTYTIGEAATLSKDSYVMFGTVLAQLAEFCMEQSEK